MTTIKDSVHDHIEVTGVAADLLDTKPVQRLRRVAQLGTVKLVYPSANHTRFEHSLGVYYLADRALAHLGVEGRQAERVRAAALLHDVGHAPFSHNVEELLHRRTGLYHDDVGGLIERTELGDVLAAHDLDPERVAGLIGGDGQYGQLVSGELDVDRMDYLVRDAHHTGVPYGTVDHERLVRELTFVDGELVLAEGNVQTAESLLVARALMNPTVYTHPVARISKAMLRRATERLLDAPDIDPAGVRRMDDPALLVALRSNPETGAFAERYDARDLFKRAVWVEYDDVPDRVRELDHEEVRDVETEVAEACELDPEAVIVDVPAEPSMKESTTEVVVNGDVRRLEDQSPLVTALRTAQRQQWRLGVYTTRAATERVGTAAADALGLDIDGALVSDVRRRAHTTLDEFTTEAE
ncbi:HD domain-containing protein [Candidatus Halobonum tyrrellensis]|uniref:Hd superfamily phosphohydrolase n=1 Tax=Candidatus Halobonum tyrrellensis G22 TaxID=1324957 RepID=V4GP20_9EURY|nr:HD domain-containing protein [Candidatus Halobonum tyrrellensis]ESP87141.1 hd superfamily phosphohydrolase [Candidatus Halobonum tyrrellensis G22]